ncbi:MAG: endonuclease/exonuclease/phosphatase family protein [Candidatus Cloacimonetes bacterium]|nr:endonuclease/exonuclease/phosphatase family protein [Candidatus Cloacimonadota bacterium]
MKILTWNCNGAFRKKHHLLKDFDADILIIQECEDPKLSTNAFKNWATNYLWSGNNKNKGIGIFAKEQYDIKKLDWKDNNLEQFLPCRINDRFNLLGVWTKYANSPNFNYIGQFWKYMKINQSHMQSDNILICGDFNSNSCWDQWDRWWNHTDVVSNLKKINVESIYHRYYSEKQGNESRPTLFHRKKSDSNYHVDYIFSSASLFDSKQNILKVGKVDDWLKSSDHMPILCTINI